MAASIAGPSGNAHGLDKQRFTRVATVGFVMMAVGMIFWLVAAIVTNGGFDPTFSLVVGAAAGALIAAVVVWRFGTIGLAVGILLAVAIMVPLFWVAFSLFAIASFVEFSGAVLFVVGGFTALGCCVAGVVRRNRAVDPTSSGEPRAIKILLGVVALALVVSGVLDLTTETTVDAATAEGAVAVSMEDFDFDPAQYSLPAGEDASFLVHNSDVFTHDFGIEALGVEATFVTPGSDVLIPVAAPEAGEYTILCSLHPDMEARLTVE